MKRSLQLLFILLATLITGSSGAWADSYTITFKTGTGDGSNVSTGSQATTVVTAGTQYLTTTPFSTATNVYYGGSNGLKLGTAKNAGTLQMTLSESGQVQPTSIVVRAKRYNESAAVTLKVNGSSTQNLTSSYADYTFNITSNITYIKLESSKYSWIESVTVNYQGATQSDPFSVTLADDNTALTQSVAGASVMLPTRSDIGDYTFVGWSETEVATETTTAPTTIPAGVYTPTADITLYPVYTRSETTDEVSEKTASVTIADYASANNWGSSSSSGQKTITLNSDITATCSSGTNSGKYYNDGWRIYQSESAKITISTANCTLKTVKFTFTNSNSGTLTYGGSALTSGTAVSVTGSSAEFTVGNSGSVTNGQIRITAIEVVYEATGTTTTYYWSSPVEDAVKKPVITVEPTFYISTTATITCATEGATTYYSYDNETWTEYTSPLTITSTTTLYAKAVKGEDESTVVTATATKLLAPTTVLISGNLNGDLDNGAAAGTLAAEVRYNDTAIDGATVTWSSSDTSVAEIGATTGAVTIKAAGDVTFTATYAGNADYAPATATCNLTVKQKLMQRYSLKTTL